MKDRQFFLPKEAINPSIAPGRGGCIATDLITVAGKRVGYMYREQPDRDLDSGWRFFAGSESQEYINDLDNMTVYDVNTIANYDPEIVPWLDAPYGTAFERDESSGSFVPTDFPADPGGDGE